MTCHISHIHIGSYTGVPQGSVFSPFLLLMYINYLLSRLQGINALVVLYAHDTPVPTKAKDSSMLIQSCPKTSSNPFNRTDSVESLVDSKSTCLF